MSDFLDRVLPAVRHHARNIRHADLRADCETQAWLFYQACEDREAVAADAFAWYAIRRVMSERFAGLRKKDAMSHAWLCGWMGQAVDRKVRRPEEIAGIREALQRLKDVATPKELEMIELVEQEMLGTFDLAERMGLSAGRISQLRRQLLQKSKE
jgi:DNA-directed RNA polymerase specialized sigma subunit